MKRQFVTLCVLSAIALNLSACGEKMEMDTQIKNDKGIASIDSQNETTTIMETDITEKIQFSDEVKTSIESTDNATTNNADEIPMIGGSDYEFSRKYIDKVYNLYLPSEVVGKEARDEWVNNVFLAKTPDEQEELPPVYQMITDLNISREDFEKVNEKYIEYPGMYFTEDIISALYQEDVNEMKRQLASPLALYHDGEVYTLDELSQTQNTRMAANIPADVMNEYLGYIERVCDENGVLKYMQEDIDGVKIKYQLYQEQAELNSETDVADIDSDTSVTDIDNFESEDVADVDSDTSVTDSDNFESEDVTSIAENDTETDITDVEELPFFPDEN